MPLTEGGISLPWCLVERRFVVEEVDVREAFGLEEAEDAFGFGGEVGEGGQPLGEPVALRRRCAERGRAKQRAERGACRCAPAVGAEERAAGERLALEFVDVGSWHC